MKQTMDIQVFLECKGRHQHTYPQILVPLKNAMCIQVGTIEYQVTPKELCLVPANTPHHCDYVGKLLAINLSLDCVDRQDAVLLSCPVVISLQGQIVQLVELIQNELRHDPGSQAVRHLYSYLYSKLLESCATPSIRYIGEHYDLPITVNQLAEIECYNVTYYNNWFKQQTGTSPSLYLRRVRVERAKDLLRETTFTVMEIAVMVGYSSNSTFTRAFHSIAGMTPKDYREFCCRQQTAQAKHG